MLVFMTGMMGSGKTTVAKHLSSLMNLPYDDLDRVIETREGHSIAEIFESHGEAYFRSREREVLSEYCRKEEGIYALGGGALCSSENWELIPEAAYTVWLKASVDTLMERLQGDRSRPLLHKDQKTQLRSLTESRSSFYARASIHVDTDQNTPREIAEMLQTHLGATSV